MVAPLPAGPAFEGGTVTHGMPGYEGAIERIHWNGADWDYKRLRQAALGICGSGLIDLLAELRRHGLMSPECFLREKKRARPDAVRHYFFALGRI